MRLAQRIGALSSDSEYQMQTIVSIVDAYLKNVCITVVLGMAVVIGFGYRQCNLNVWTHV